MSSRNPPPGEPEVVKISRRHVYQDHEGNDKAPIRYANMELGRPPQDVIYKMATVKKKLVLRETPAGRRNLRATFSETDRYIGSLDINHYTESTGNLHPAGSVTLHGREIEVLANFIETIQRVKLAGTGPVAVEPGALDYSHFVTDADITQALRERPELLREVLRNPNLGEDLRAIGYWRKSLAEFEALLNNNHHFEDVRLSASNTSAENVWQRFFESNTWIFGYGLLYISVEGISQNGLQQSLRTRSIVGSSSIPDAIMRTRGAVSNLCLVEIKTHTTSLLGSNKRGGSFLVSKELSDAVSQCQTSVSVAEETIHQQFHGTDNNGFQITDPIFSFRPRSILVIGNLSQFRKEIGYSVEAFRTFEMYRRSLITPEIVTYDELYDRARLIVDSVAQV